MFIFANIETIWNTWGFRRQPICDSERGKGDSVKEIADYWGNTDIETIYHRVKTWKDEVRTEA